MSILYSRVNRIEDETVEVVGCERGEDETETVLGDRLGSAANIEYTHDTPHSYVSYADVTSLCTLSLFILFTS